MKYVMFLPALAGLGICLAAVTRGEDGGKRPTITDTAPSFGLEAEKKRLRKVAADIKKERADTDKYDNWLKGEEKDLKQQEKEISSAQTGLKRQRVRFRCPNGLTLEACLARPPVCRSARAFKARYDSEMEKLKRKSKQLGRKKKDLAQKRQQLEDRRAKLQQAIKNYNADIKLLGKRSKRSPAEGLFFDESIPKRPR